jgi:hypothetical protein
MRVKLNTMDKIIRLAAVAAVIGVPVRLKILSPQAF